MSRLAVSIFPAKLGTVKWTTDYNGETYLYVETAKRARISVGDRVLWWGDVRDPVPRHCDVPLVVLLTFSIVRRATS